MQSVHKTVATKSRKICSVPQCSSYCTEDISLHAFPTDPKLRRTWQTVLKIGKPVSKYMLVCSQHFTNSDFFPGTATNEKRHNRRLKKHVIPSQKIPQVSHPVKKTGTDRSKRHWLQKCTLNLMDKENIDEEIMDVEIPNNEKNLEIATTSKKTALVPNIGPVPSIFYEDKATETPFSDFFELPQILNTDEKLINFTGINFDILRTIAKCARKTADFNSYDWSNMEDRIILVLCKIKLNISFACLAVLFKMTKTQCTHTFYSTVSLLAVSLKPAIYWPSKEECLKNMPKCFEKFKNTRVVLDYTEIHIQRLKCLKCRVRSYSHYKGTHTLKYLIGITPSGLISFVSAGFGGRATDKAIFNYENVLDKLDAHDAVMVDKGFLIEQECNERLVKLIRPPFLRKKNNLVKKRPKLQLILLGREFMLRELFKE